MWSRAEEDQKISLAWFLIAAALFHAVLWKTGNFPLPPLVNPFAARSAAPIEIESFENSVKRPVVQTDVSPFDKSKLKEKSRYAGEVDNRVEQETHAPASGKFMPGGAALQRGRPLPGEKQEKKDIEGTDDGDVPQTDLKDWRRTDNIGMSDLMAYGASPYKFPTDVKEGANTLLNTDKVSYASYINRIADEIYGPWVDGAQEAARSLADSGKKFNEEGYVTKIGVTLDDSGSVLGIQTLQSSGIEMLDDACRKAFWSTQPFPNPPAQLFTKERRVSLIYEFHFEMRGSLFGIFPRRI